MKTLSNKIILITGAGKGAGRALALACAAQGAFVAANDISPINVEDVVSEITAAGGQARAYIHDVAKKLDAQAMLNALTDEFGRIDVLLNCANVQPSASLLDLDEWDLHRVFEVNAIGTFLMMQLAGRVMRAQGSGIIINVVRLAANSPASYIASCASIPALSQRADSELQPYGIRVFAIDREEAVTATLNILTTP